MVQAMGEESGQTADATLAGRPVYSFIDQFGNPMPYDGVSPLRWRVGAYVLAIRTGRVLMVEPPHTSLWELPGGGVEVHELMVDGAARECLEETGYRFVAASAEPFYVGEGFVCWNPEQGVYYHMIGAVFRGAVDGEPDPTRPHDPTEIRRVAWFDPT